MTRILLFLLGLSILGLGGCDDGKKKKPTSTGEVTLNFDPASDGPRLSDKYQIVGLDADGHVIFGPVSVAKATQIMLSGVPREVERLQVTFLLGSTMIGTLSAPVDLSPGSALVDLTRLMQTPVAKLQELVVTPTTATVAIGGVQDYRANGRFDDGAMYDLTALVAWASSNGGLVTIDAGGRARGLAAGTTQITASLSEVTSAPVTLTVTPAAQPSDLPTVSAVTPTTGPSTGGTQVTITGTNLQGATLVMFGTVAATNISNVSGTSLTATTPPSAPGRVSVKVSTPKGESTPTTASEFSFFAMAAVGSVTPSRGPQAGGTTIAIAGSGFTGATAVNVGGHAVTSFEVDSDTLITAVTPPGAGIGQVTVTTPSGTSTTGPSTAFSYVPPPTVGQVGPGNGPTTGGNPVVFTGENLEETLEVLFGEATATFTVDSATQVTATAPAGTGVVSVRLRTVGGLSEAFDYAYLPIAALASLAPSAGPLAGGNGVTLTGTGLGEATNVDFGDLPALSFTVNSDTQITAYPPAGTGVVPVRVTTPVGHSNGVNYRYAPVPTISTPLPSVGPESGGNPVSLSGTGFSGATEVRFGSAVATQLLVQSDTALTVVAPAGAGNVTITVTTPGGTSSGVSYQYSPAPALASITPVAGPQTGGTLVTLNGTGFTGATAVRFGSASASEMNVFSDTQITAVSPAGSGSVEVTVVSPGGASNAVPFLYAPIPVAGALGPSTGPEPGGYPVVITGTSFIGVTGVRFGTVEASFSVQSPTQLTATAPPGTGVVQVTVTAAGGVSPGTSYTYAPGASVVTLSPSRGPVDGGNTVTLYGGPFTGATAVAFGSTPATSFTVVSDGQIDAVAPAGTGQVNVTVSTAGGNSNPLAYTYVELPQIDGVSPAIGPLVGGNSVTLTGAHFTQATEVHFGAIPATTFTVDTDTQITAVAPPGTGAVDVTVTTAGGESDPFSYTYSAPSMLVTMIPSRGPISGGQTIVLTGSGFENVSGVSFGSTPAAGFTVDSPTRITVTSPPGTSTVNVRVTTLAGQSNPLPYAFADPPSLSAVDPPYGLVGMPILVDGTNLFLTTGVTVGGMPAQFSVVSNTRLQVTLPATPPGQVDITVTTPGGSATLQGAFGYVLPPDVLSISPVSGPTSGNTAITIFGNFLTTTRDVQWVQGNLSTSLAYQTVDDSTVMIASPPGNGSAQVVVTTYGGQDVAPMLFSYIPPPVVASISPNYGSPDGNTSVTIAGTNFAGGSVTIGGVPLVGATINLGGTSITGLTPAGAPGASEPVVVTTASGPSNSDVPFNYAPEPVITAVTPNYYASGNVSGQVVLTGTGFTGATQVLFGTTPGTNLVVDSDTQISVRAPAGTGNVPVSVVALGGTGTRLNAFTYAAVIDSVTPSSAVVAANSSVQVTLAGSGFTNATSVSFGGTPASGLNVVDDGQATVIAPPGQGQTVNVSITTPAGTATRNNGFTYLGPRITAVTPSSGNPSGNGGVQVILTGVGFTNATSVDFGSIQTVSSFTSINDTQITLQLTTPGSGSVPVTVTTPDGAFTLANGYSYVTAKRVFVTHDVWNGAAIGGLAGADAKCQAAATAGGLSGTYKAWLSDGTAAAISRLSHPTSPYVLPNGVQVADNWSDFVQAAHEAPINVTQFGVVATTAATACNNAGAVWTNTWWSGFNLTDGTYNACANWSSTSGGAFLGNRNAFTNNDWTDLCSGTNHCNSTAALYCLEQ